MKNKLKRGFLALLAIGAALALGVHSASAQIKVACVGDSITAGYGLSNPGTQSYPAQLQALLGSGYTVGNFGWSGATALKSSDNSYWNTSGYRDSKTFKPNIVIIMFGANDSKSWNWNAANFNADYLALIAQYQGLTSQPKVYVCYTPPMFLPTAFGTTFDPVFIENTVEPAIAGIATQAPVPLIDNETPFINRPDLFQDGVHPTTAGAAILAQRVADAINGLTPTNITSAAITSSVNPSASDATVTFTATISSANGTPTGSVIFAANNVPFSTNTLSGGTASASCSFTTFGNNVVAAQYLSQGNYLGVTHSLYQNVLLPPMNGPVVYAFEGNAQDSSANGFDGTANAVTYVTGKVGSQAAQFNGTSSYVSIPRSISDDFTVAMWVKTTDTAGSAGAQWWSGKGLVDGEVGGGGADWGTAIVNGNFVIGIGSTSGDQTFASSVTVNDGTWHHLAATRNTTSGAVEVYVDGVLRGSGTGATGSRTFPPNLRIGSLQTGNNFLNGTLDDVRLYDYILTASEIAALANTQSSAPAAPTGLGAAGGSGVVNLNWTQSVSPGITGNNVYRSTTGNGGPYNLLANLAASTAYADTAVTAGATYFYSVTAVNTNGESALSAYAGATTVSTGPTAPTSLTASSTVKKQIKLTWTQSASPNITNNKIYRATTSGGPYTLVATIAPATTYNNTGLSSGTTYYYVVTAVNSSSQESSYSNQASIAAK